MPSVSDLWKTNPRFFDGKSIQQVLAICGDGHLREGNETSLDFRGFLSMLPSPRLVAYAAECLAAAFKDGGLVLQDIVNELGVRLGFQVVRGRYRGTRNEVGFDGLWTGRDGFQLVVEVKTTDAFRINLDAVAAYRSSLIADRKIEEDRSSLLIVVGREDTGDLEAQVRGSRYAWDTRLISVDSLCNLVSVREKLDDVATSTMISEILKPREYTRLDPIIELVFATSADAEDAEAPFEPSTMAEADERDPGDGIDVAALRNSAIGAISRELGVVLARQSRSAYQTADHKLSVICLPSKRYTRGRGNWYWFTFRESQRTFLDASPGGFVCFVCGQPDQVLLIPKERFIPLLDEMRSTRGRYQAEIDWATESVLLDSPRRDLTEFVLA